MEFVTFEIAKKLKEKGYPFNTSHHYNRDGDIIVALCDYDERCEYPMPEIHQVLKWLREEKKLHIRVSVYFVGWCVDVTNMDGKRMYGTECEYYNYEQAALAGIEYVLDNLI